MNAIDELFAATKSNTPPLPTSPASSPVDALFAMPHANPPAPSPSASALDQAFGAPLSTPDAATQPPQPSPAEEKRGRGRPKGSKNKKIEEQVVAEQDAKLDALEAEEQPTLPPQPAGPPKAWLEQKSEVHEVYIDCMPCRALYNTFDEMVAPVLAELAKMKLDKQGDPDANGVSFPDWRMVPYGKGTAFVRGALANMELPWRLVIDTRNPLAAECLSVLEPRATHVVRRF